MHERTALTMAVVSGREDVVRVLLESGADPNQVIRWIWNHAESDAGFPGWPDQYSSDRHGQRLLAIAPTSAIVGLLLQAGASPHVRDQDGGTPLMNAAAHGAVEAVATLLSAGADPALRSAEDGTALRYAHEALDEELDRSPRNERAVLACTTTIAVLQKAQGGSIARGTTAPHQ